MYTWHFSNGQLGYDRSDEIKAGLSLACAGDSIGLCDYGFHSSNLLIDALRNAKGNFLSLCEVGGKIIEGDDEVVSSIRRHIAVGAIERTLHLFAIWCAEQALSLVDKPDERSLQALAVKRLWMDSKATDDELARASAAAGAAAWDAARVAVVAWDADAAAAAAVAWVAAWVADAARDAVGDEAVAAARAAVWAGAGAAARATAVLAARDAVGDEAVAAARAAVWAGAGAAVGDEAREEQNVKLTEMVLELPEFAPYKDLYIAQ